MMNKHLNKPLFATLIAASVCSALLEHQPSVASSPPFAPDRSQIIKVDSLPAGGEAPINAASSISPILHLLSRITFGPTVEDIALVKQIGINAYISRQLQPQTIEESPQVAQLVANSEAVSAPPLDLMRNYSRVVMAAKAKEAGVTDKKDIQKQIGQQYKELYQQMLKAKLVRNVESPRQLEEVMTDFWFNHFNISVNKNQDRFLVASFEEQAIRPYALGRFRDLLEATAHHPAMLFYLDNWENTDPNSNGARGRFKGINENYARELMELHTLGVDGGYSQTDVVALAHILTGLGIPPLRLLARGRIQPERFGAFFDSNRHDFSTKQLLGVTIRGQGESEIEQALDILAMHPATAHHISYQLAQYFVSDNPPAQLVDHLSQTYLKSGGDIRTVMAALLRSPEFWSTSTIGSKYKSPYRYTISVLRASGADVENFKRVDQFLKQLGEPLYGCLTPDGYKNTKEAWLNSDGLLKRIAFAGAIARGTVGATPDDESERVEQIIGPRMSEQTLHAISSTQGKDKAGLMLGCPEFMTY